MRRTAIRVQRGQSVVEFATLSIALIPLFLLIPLIGRYLDLAQTTELAARYAAFEGTVAHTASAWKPDTQLALEVRRRFFGNSDAPIKSADAAGDFAAHRNPLWSDHAGRPLLADFGADVTVDTDRSRAATLPVTLALGAEGFNLPVRNLYTGTVTVRPRDIAGLTPFDRFGLEIRRHQVMLVDGWSAREPGEVSRRIADGGHAVYPITPLKLLGDTVGQLPTLLLDPAMRVGDIDADVVPCDRLESGC